MKTTKKRWECTQVKRIPITLDEDDYQERVALIAKELYSVLNQLQDQSESLIHPGETLNENSEAKTSGFKGASDGTKPIQNVA